MWGTADYMTLTKRRDELVENLFPNPPHYANAPAALVAEWDDGDYDWDYFDKHEELYRTDSGEFFLHGIGGFATNYGGYKLIIPLTEDEAKRLVEQHCAEDVYDELFGDAPA